MRKALLVLIAVAALAACTSHKTVVDSNGTTVTTSGTGDNQTVTVQGKEGSFSAGKNAVDTAKLGLPVYPGADASQNAGYSGQSKEGSGSMVVLKTSDAFDKVYAWYQKQMPAGSEQSHVTANGQSMAAFVIGKNSDKEQKTVTLTSDTDGTNIMLVVGTKNQ